MITMAWAVWFCRNKYVYAYELVNEVATTPKFLRLVESYCTYAQQVSPSLSLSSQQRHSNASWAKPVCGTVKVNTDAHVVKGEYVSLWLVCRYDTGKVLLAAPKRLEVDWDLAMAEGAASRYGI